MRRTPPLPQLPQLLVTSLDRIHSQWVNSHKIGVAPIFLAKDLILYAKWQHECLRVLTLGIESKRERDMSANIFDKILRIIQIVVTLLQMAVKAFTNFEDDDEDANTD